jgi:CBS domain-containing protein
MANTLFWVGLMRGMPEEYKEIWNLVDFKDAKGNFNTAAQSGIESTFNWFDKSYTARKLIRKVLLPLAEKGLKKSNISENDILYYLDIIKNRIQKNSTGSKWATRSFRNIKKNITVDEANVIVTAGMYQRQREGKPVAEWSLVDIQEGDAIPNKHNKVRNVMETQLFAVNENDPIRLVKKVAKWKKIKHLPVVNDAQDIVGAISTQMLKDYKENDETYDVSIPTKEIMSRSVVMVTSDTPVNEALEIIKKQNVNCLFVMENKHLVGIFNKENISDSA